MKVIPRNYSVFITENEIITNSASEPTDISAILSLSETFGLARFPNLKPKISEHCAPTERILSFGDGRVTTRRAIEFSVKIDNTSLRKIIYDIEKEIDFKKDRIQYKPISRNYTHAGFLIYNRVIRDLEYFASVMLISGHLSNQAPFETSEIFWQSLSREILPSQFRLIPVMARRKKYSIKCIPLESVFSNLIKCGDY